MDALIQTHLDPGVCAIKSTSTTETFDDQAPNATLILRREGLFELRVRPSEKRARSTIAAAPYFKHRVWTLKEEDVLAVPVRKNARDIWGSRTFKMSVHLRMSALNEVQHRSLPYGELAVRLKSFKDAEQAVLYLAWVGAIQFEAGPQPIGPSTLVSATKD
jgi:hypothetical protein